MIRSENIFIDIYFLERKKRVVTRSSRVNEVGSVRAPSQQSTERVASFARVVNARCAQRDGFFARRARHASCLFFASLLTSPNPAAASFWASFFFASGTFATCHRAAEEQPAPERCGSSFVFPAQKYFSPRGRLRLLFVSAPENNASCRLKQQSQLGAEAVSVSARLWSSRAGVISYEGHALEAREDSRSWMLRELCGCDSPSLSLSSFFLF